MIESEILEKIRHSSIEDQIAIIEVLLQSLKSELSQKTDDVVNSTQQPQRPKFGFMQDTGSILSDIVAPVLPENTWEALQ